MQPSPDESRNSSRDRSRTSVSGHSASASARGPRPPAATSIMERTAGEGVGRGEGLPSYKKRPFRRTPDAPRPLASAAWARLVLQTGLPDREDGGRVVGRATSSDPWPHLHNHWPLGPVGGVVGASARGSAAYRSSWLPVDFGRGPGLDCGSTGSSASGDSRRGDWWIRAPDSGRTTELGRGAIPFDALDGPRRRRRRSGPAQAPQGGRVRRLHPGQHLLDPQLRRALPRWRGDLQCVRGVVGQPGGEQADGQKAEMRWTPKGAHLLLQVRTRVLNDELGDAFRRWYPEVVSAPKAALAA